jgi:transposase InsO family protein
VKFGFIAAHAACWPVARQCRALGVSPSGYYRWRSAQPGARSRANAGLADQIRSVHGASRGLYGSPRVHAALRAAGTLCSRGRVERLMRKLGLRGRTPRRFVVTTLAGGAYQAADNRLARRFAPGQVSALVSDITALETGEGWLYVAVTLCLRTRQVLGWSMGEQLHGALGLEALRMALLRCAQPAGTLHHSDRGGQYVSCSFQALLGQHGLVASMSRRGNCWDNAVAESFFATLKRELGQARRIATRSLARQLVFDYIEGFYNRRRLHSSLGYATPEAYAKLISDAIPPVH